MGEQEEYEAMRELASEHEGQPKPSRGFDPGQHLTSLKGQDYLEVKWRLVWFRSEYPKGRIETQVHHISSEVAVVHATATAVSTDNTVVGVGSGIGSCTPQQFKSGYIEKAETKAIGRALGSLGFGTQFADDFADGDEASIADSPIQRQPQASPRPLHAPQQTQTGQAPLANQPRPQGQTFDVQAVINRMHGIGANHGMDHDDLKAIVLAKAAKEGCQIQSTKEAPPEMLVEIANSINRDPQPFLVFLSNRKQQQAELMPSPQELPNPRRTADSYTHN